jgi:hypothetical protein
MLRELRETYPLWSERTIARFKAAMERLIALGLTIEQVNQAITDAQRTTGTVRVALLERYARWLEAGEPRGAMGKGQRK